MAHFNWAMVEYFILVHGGHLNVACKCCTTLSWCMVGNGEGGALKTCAWWETKYILRYMVDS